ncbi:hypothetical protein Rhopal_001944-T1 [Rhodotorula paludigena]|uniref:Uncharacterized protein n=1 Tax=Rhodotorula paludigena TaxID=86838 RepID=A0AAV5GJW8_9BASI|nr:hypothetical protein Rhopal_001944-T1 [Rhodotorula paludigena]
MPVFNSEAHFVSSGSATAPSGAEAANLLITSIAPAQSLASLLKGQPDQEAAAYKASLIREGGRDGSNEEAGRWDGLAKMVEERSAPNCRTAFWRQVIDAAGAAGPGWTASRIEGAAGLQLVETVKQGKKEAARRTRQVERDSTSRLAELRHALAKPSQDEDVKEPLAPAARRKGRPSKITKAAGPASDARTTKQPILQEPSRAQRAAQLQQDLGGDKGHILHYLIKAGAINVNYPIDDWRCAV